MMLLCFTGCLDKKTLAMKTKVELQTPPYFSPPPFYGSIHLSVSVVFCDTLFDETSQLDGKVVGFVQLFDFFPSKTMI